MSSNITAPPLDNRGKVDLLMVRFYERPNVDVPIAEVFALLYPDEAHLTDDMPARSMQQRIGMFITRANARMEMHKIVPGELKRTYRLVKIASA
jgi:hypothetical protein